MTRNRLLAKTLPLLFTLAAVGRAQAQTPQAPAQKSEGAPPSGWAAEPGLELPETPAPEAEPEAPAAAPEKAPGAPPDSDAEPGLAPVPPAPSELTARPLPAPTHDQAVEEAPDDGSLGRHQEHIFAQAAVRTSFVSHDGLDPFAENDALIQLSLGVGGVFWTHDRFSLAGLFLWDYGTRSAEARGLDSDLHVHRLTIGAEGRYHVLRQLFGFARVAPGALHSIASIDGLDGVSHVAREWAFAADLSAGAMFEFTGFGTAARSRRLGGWLGLEGGYGWAGETDLTMIPESDGATDGASGIPERTEPYDLGKLAVRGPFVRILLALSY